jgi:hypothetical protein
MKLVVGCLLAGLVTAATGSSANSPTKRFAVVFSGSGSYSVDFGDDRLEEVKKKPTSGGGVDGKASVAWSWTLRTVASQSGDKPVLHDRAILQASYRTSGGFLVYSFFRDGEMSERPIVCDYEGNRRTFDGKQRAAFRGDWVKWNPRLTYDIDSVSFSARIPSSLAPSIVGCYHSIYEGMEDENAYVPSRISYNELAFNRRVGKSYRGTAQKSINLPRGHQRIVDIPQLHTVSGEVQSEILVTRIIEETWRKRTKQYRESPKFRASTD